MNPHLHPRHYHGCYGDIMTMETFGAPCDINNLMNCAKNTFYSLLGFYQKKLRQSRESFPRGILFSTS
ncbi:hypothetical protein A6R68_06857, partial [Neotoma lepida]